MSARAQADLATLKPDEFIQVNLEVTPPRASFQLQRNQWAGLPPFEQKNDMNPNSVTHFRLL